MKPLLTVRQVAQILGLKETTITRKFRSRQLKGFKIGKMWRTTEERLKEYILNGKNKEKAHAK